MAENKTKPEAVPVASFIQTLEEKRKAEAETLIEMFQSITGYEPVMWGPSIIGFGSYDYRYESGRTGTSLRMGFSPRKAALVIYVVPGFVGLEQELRAIGPHRHEKSCLYIKSLSKMNLPALKALATKVWDMMAQNYPR